MAFENLTPQQLKERLDSGEKLRLIDVREPWEYNYNRIEGAELFPMSEISRWYNQLDPDEEYVVYCHHGMRSMQVCQFLLQSGFENVKNLMGGIDAWSDVDPAVPRY